MISTLYFFQFIAFYFWQFTSRYAKTDPVAKFSKILYRNKKLTRGMGMVIFALTCAGFIYHWGLLSGFCGFIIGVMGMGCLSVVITPFQYLRLPAIAAIYLCCFMLEIII